MTADDLRALSAAATPGPWKQGDGRGCDELTVYINDGTPGDHVAETWDETDAELVVWLRNHADALADLIDAVAMLNEPVPPDWPVGKFVWRPIHERALDGITTALAALDQEAPT